MFTTLTLGAAFGCPFEGEVPVDRVAGARGEAAAAGVQELALGDTIGVGVPPQVRELTARIRDAVGAEPPLRLHFHNTRNTGFANAFAAVEDGVTVLDSSAGGIGGCPFAPEATGNIATDDLVYLLDRMGVRHRLRPGGAAADRGVPVRAARARGAGAAAAGRHLPGLIHPARDPPV